MASPKRPRLFYRSEDDRAADRSAVRIPAACEVGGRPPEDVLVTDIGPTGCKLLLVSIGVTRCEPVILRTPDEAPISGRLKWIKQGSLGMTFDTPLDPAVLERLLAIGAPSNVVALHRP